MAQQLHLERRLRVPRLYRTVWRPTESPYHKQSLCHRIWWFGRTGGRLASPWRTAAPAKIDWNSDLREPLEQLRMVEQVDRMFGCGPWTYGCPRKLSATGSPQPANGSHIEEDIHGAHGKCVLAVQFASHDRGQIVCHVCQRFGHSCSVRCQQGSPGNGYSTSWIYWSRSVGLFFMLFISANKWTRTTNFKC